MTMCVCRNGVLITLRGTKKEIMEQIRSWCPSGFLIEIFRRGRLAQ